MIKIALEEAEAEELQKFVQEHIDKCYEQMDYDSCCNDMSCYSEEQIEELENFEPYGPFCGCDTCQTREYIMATTEFLRFIGKADIYVK